MDIVTRLKAYMDHIGLQISQFADQAQIPRPTLSQILSGRNKKISNELLSKLHAAFPTLNISWLLFGDGEMDAVASPSNVQPQPQQPLKEKQPIAADNIQSKLDLEPLDAQEEQKSFNQPKKAPETAPLLSLTPDSTKKIQNIMVFYSDNSFEIFTPAAQQ